MRTLTVYRVAPQNEHRAAKELREHGIRAYVPKERTTARRPPVARGYVFATHKPAFAKHVANAIGPVTKSEVARIYQGRPRTERTARFTLGDRVMVKVGADVPMVGIVSGDMGKGWQVTVQMFGKPCPVVFKQRDIQRIRIDPG